MAMLNGGRMIALFLSMLFALNVSFAQDDWVTVAVYMVDPIGDEEVTQEVEEYMVKWRDPLLWTTFERDFTPAREAQLAQVARDNAARIRAAELFLKADIRNRGDGTSSWFPAWIPLALATTTEDSLFKNILGLEGSQFGVPSPGDGDRRQTLREFFEIDGYEPDGLNANGSQKFRACDDTKPRCRKELFAIFSDLVEVHDSFQASRTEFGSGRAAPCLGCPVEVYDDIMMAPRIISFTIRVRGGTPVPSEDLTFVGEQNEQGITKSLDNNFGLLGAEFDYASIRLLQPAVHDPDEYVIDVAPYWRPAAKPVSAAATEASSWGRIKATLAD